MYAGMNQGGMHHTRRATPEEIGVNIWLAPAGEGEFNVQVRPTR